jgi:hypothetical protein
MKIGVEEDMEIDRNYPAAGTERSAKRALAV